MPQARLRLGLEGKQVAAFTKFVTALYGAFVELDCAIVEINPLVVTGAGDIVALDAKVSFDDSALFRHKDLEALRDDSEMDPKELDGGKHDLNYVALDGEIGCMVNGAGLAMATMDIIKLYGGEPANFLDVGGGANASAGDRGVQASSPPTERRRRSWSTSSAASCKCDMIAEGIVAARKKCAERAAGRAARGHECRARQEDPGRERPADHPGRQPRRRGPEGRRRREEGRLTPWPFSSTRTPAS
jgi:succinyl-CoA synthetase beta subunit